MKKFVFKTEPWEHQTKALSYLYPRNSAALYTDMGTGKTKIMIDLIINRGFKRVLVVAPSKACAVWQSQIKIHSDLCSNHVINVCGVSTADKLQLLNTTLKKQSSVANKECYIIICNYEGVWREPFDKYLMRKTVGIDCVICDESHRIKSPSSRCSRFLSKLGKLVPNRYLVTGTPLAENPVDVYAQYRFLDPNVFGTNFGNFCSRYQNIDAEATSKVGYPVLNKDEPYINLDELREKMFSCAFYAKSSVKLPPTTDVVTEFEPSAKLQKCYNEFKKSGGFIELKSGVVSTENVLAQITREQQMLSGFVPVENEDGEQKIVQVDKSRREALRELLEGISAGEPVVVFAKYRNDLKAISVVAKSIGVSYGEVSGRRDDLEIWKSGKLQLLGVQYSSGSESIDLTRARYCIYYSLTHSLSLYLQSRKRTHRPNQTRPVTYIHLVGVIPKVTTIDQKYLS